MRRSLIAVPRASAFARIAAVAFRAAIRDGNCLFMMRSSGPVADVENGKRTAFKPHTSPPTKEVLRVLRELKGTFPGLDDAALVGAISPDQVMLSAALRTECQFIDQLVAPSHDDGP